MVKLAGGPEMSCFLVTPLLCFCDTVFTIHHIDSVLQVIAIYDYRAQRSDELTLYKGDVITVLYKDNESWWMGELSDGQQGFFPSNYVTDDGT